MAGIDAANQFPGSLMAAAARLGQSRFVSTDVSGRPVGEQSNTSIASPTALTIPTGLGANGREIIRPTYAVITATGGVLYYTIDGSVPSATNNAGQIAAGASAPFYGYGLLQALRVLGSTMSVGYYW